MYEVKGFQSIEFEELIRKVNKFLSSLADGNLIDIKYNTTPLDIRSHTEYGVHPDSKYTALVIFKK
ncbi:sporulation protein Cse60 [Bacillus sp. FJAT-29814]|uniref:sporulation protein Cse60 n=1 Tax=Bacillus sp. FJAT-29814 TaxID=1729688 RepID=UPI00082C7CDD|nr:sporulation protein Cse60 [Bacillus sp. FJAT-29814]